MTGGRGGSEAGPKHGRLAGGLWHDILDKIIGGGDPIKIKKNRKKLKFEKILIFQINHHEQLLIPSVSRKISFFEKKILKNI